MAKSREVNQPHETSTGLHKRDDSSVFGITGIVKESFD